MAWRKMAKAASAMALVAALSGCDDEPVQRELPVRPIKSFVVSEAAGTTARRFSGVSEATERTALSFAVHGTIREVAVKVGQPVSQGDLIASLDPVPFELDISAAEAEVRKAESDLEVKRGDLDRNQQLFDKNWISIAAIEKYQSAHDAAESTLAYARSRLALAERNLANTMLHAPYDGQIATRLVDAFEEVGAGQPVAEIHSVDGLAVSFAVPEVGLSEIRQGQSVDVSFAALQGASVTGRITEIETSASAGNAYTVKASLIDPPATLRPGMTASVTARADAAPAAPGYFVPLAAIAPGDSEFTGSVYRFDREASVVHRVAVRVDGVRDNLVIVTEGLEPGDIVASAGVSFLMDGQAVRLLEE